MQLIRTVTVLLIAIVFALFLIPERKEAINDPVQAVAVVPAAAVPVVETPVAEVVPEPEPEPEPPVEESYAPAYTGGKDEWLIASGIPESEWGYVDYIVQHESSWNPESVNSSSGACGLGQQLPCGKWKHEWNDPVGGLIDMDDYVRVRYGTWENAYNWWLIHRWY